MKTSQLEKYFTLLSEVKFNNVYGGEYAFIQVLAYNREILRLLRPLGSFRKQAESIEAISWMLNEYLGMKFTHRHRSIFEAQMFELKKIYASIIGQVEERYAEMVAEPETGMHMEAA
jgi:hypothetical protein